jgi:hypothetical protein
MKQIRMFGFALFILLSGVSSNAPGNKNENLQKTVSTKVEVYYFHFTRRCNTCMSVETTAKQAVEALYADKIKAGEYTFKAINLDDASSKAIAGKLGIGGQTLLIVCGNQKVDITDKGFMNAHNLDRMKKEIKMAVEQAIKG